MGRHVATGRRRGIAGWPVIVLAVVVLLVAGSIVYFAVLRADQNTDAGECSGIADISVLASSGSSPAARALSDAFNATAPAARSTCLTSSVVTLDGADAARALMSGWAGRPDPAPGVWLTDDPSTLAAVEADDPDLTAGRDSDPVATSPVVLAARSADIGAIGADLRWSGLPGALGPDGTIRSADGTPMPVQLPDPQSNRASVYALSSVMASGSTGPTVAQARAGKATALSLTSSTDSDSPVSTLDALDALASGRTAGVVPVTEADLASFNASAPDPLQAVYPTGPTAGDEVFVVSLATDGLDPTQRDAATRFHSFARSAAGQMVIAATHLRVEGVPASASAGISPTSDVTPLAAAAPGVAAAWSAALGFGPLVEDTGSPTTDGTPSDQAGTDPPAPPTVPSSGPVTAPSSGPAPSSVPSATSRSTTPPASTSKTPTSTPASPTTRPSTSRSTTPPALPDGPSITFVVETSSTWSTEISGRTRTGWLQEALTRAVGAAGNRSVGLWSMSSADGAQGYRPLVTTEPLDTARRSALTAAIAQLTPSGDRRYYATAPAALQQAAQTSSAATPHRVILVTDGTDQTPGTPRADVVAALQQIAADNPHVHLDVLGVGESAPESVLQTLADAGHGRYIDVRSTTYLPDLLVQAVNDAG